MSISHLQCMHFITQLHVLPAGFHFDTEDGDKVLPGFIDSIVGIRPGEMKSFPLVFPESWKQENLRGVHAQFTVSAFISYESNYKIKDKHIPKTPLPFSDSNQPFCSVKTMLNCFLG